MVLLFCFVLFYLRLVHVFLANSIRAESLFIVCVWFCSLVFGFNCYMGHGRAPKFVGNSVYVYVCVYLHIFFWVFMGFITFSEKSMIQQRLRTSILQSIAE